MSLSGRVALVTGASRNPGLGRSIALAFAAEGVNVVLAGRSRKDVLEANAAEIRARGGKALACLVDVTESGQVEMMVSTAVKEFGRVDILVNCAGARGDVSMLDMTVEQWRTVLAVNLDGAFNCVRAVAPHMVRRGYGRIINMAGISGQLGDPNRAHVVTAKAGLIGFTKAAAIELGRHGITVNAVSPGIIDTPRPAGAALEKRRKRIAESPLGRAGSGDDIANACLFLVSDEAAFITGQTLNVNGGAFMG